MPPGSHNMGTVYKFTTAALLAVATSQKTPDPPLLFCEPTKIIVNITKAYLRSQRLEINDPQQIHFNNNPNCFAQEQGNAYILSLYHPFTSCGTDLQHTTEDYIYTNLVVLDKKNGAGVILDILEMRCIYEDKYVVSSGPITPTKNTLQFETFYGKFEADMKLYESDRFDENSKLSDRPSVMLGQKVYVGVSLHVPKMSQDSDYVDDLTVTVKNCYANDNSDFKLMERYHYLVSGMCASPEDDTVDIYANGQQYSKEARFSFDMFRFRKGLEYIYLHCEIKLCNITSEVCEGDLETQPLCNGKTRAEQGSRKRRGITDSFYDSSAVSDGTFVLPPYDVQAPLNPWSDSIRSKRSLEDDEEENTGDDMPDPQSSTLAFLSRGPVVAATTEKKPTSAHVKTLLPDTVKDDHFLRLWVFSGVAAVIGIVGIILTVFTIIRRRTEAAKLQQNGTVIRVETPAPKNGVGNTTSGNSWRTGPLPVPPSH